MQLPTRKHRCKTLRGPRRRGPTPLFLKTAVRKRLPLGSAVTSLSLPMALKIGDSAPEFSLPDQNGETVSLAALRGQRVVLYFYPKDDTPGCTKEACNFRDQWSSFKAAGIRVLGVSKDPATSHGRFISKYDLPFTLLTDTEPCPVATAYESYGLKKFMGREYMGMMRHTFVIDAEGRFERIYIKVKAETMADQILADLGLG